MTRKLYYEDSYQSQFEARVISCEAVENGYAIVLDQTAFYPGGGGQPYDLGLLGGLEIEAMYEEEDTIYHVVNAPLEVGSLVVGDVFMEKRMDYMAQHSGEHILSGILHEGFGYANVGFHLSESYMTADFDGELTKQQLDLLELKANDAVMSNVPIRAKVYPIGEDTPSYRSKLAFDEEVRLVDIAGYDTCACCGTHLKMSGEIGAIKIVDYEKHRGGCRLTVLCGRRAIYDYQARFDELGEVSATLSAKVGKVG
ncbi:MAG: alanyl-tRNA editing protein, partial [Cellulosilyticaceae bacterium]